MKSAIFAVLLVLASCVPSLCQQQLDAATKEDVEELMDVTGARARIQQMWSQMAQQSATTAADSYRVKHPDATPLQLRKVAELTGQYMLDTTKVFSIDELIAAMVPVYQEHFTHADVRGIIEFYHSSTGQKYLKELPAIMAESSQAIDPIIKKHIPELQAAAEKMAEESAKGAESDKGDAASSH